MLKHVKNDEVISRKKVKTIENKLNEHADYAVKVTNAGENTCQTRRIKGNLKTKDNQIPILSGTHKDHKKVDDDNVGPDLRPIMGATVGPNIGLSNFIGGKVIRNITEAMDDGNVCKSTEEMIYHFEKYNKERVEKGYDKKEMVLGSMDIEKWYNNVLAEPSARIVGRMFVDSKVEIEGVDYTELSKYLGKFMTKEEILAEDMQDILFINKKKMKDSKEGKNKKTKETKQINKRKEDSNKKKG